MLQHVLYVYTIVPNTHTEDTKDLYFTSQNRWNSHKPADLSDSTEQKKESITIYEYRGSETLVHKCGVVYEITGCVQPNFTQIP